MSETVSEFFLSAMLAYGAPILGLAVTIDAAGVPLPASLLLIAAGAFARQGAMDAVAALVLGLAGAVLGDSLSFGIGRFARRTVEARLGASASWQRARTLFEQRGGLAIFLTRFLLTALALPINLIAGGSGYRFSRFLLFDLSGEALWLVLYGGLGYLFGAQWELISQFLSDFGSLLLGVVILAGGVYSLIRHYRRTAPRLSDQ